MKSTTKSSKSRERNPDLRMKQFIESVIQEVEEAGIDDEHAANESEPKPSVSVNDPGAYARTRP